MPANAIQQERSNNDSVSYSLNGNCYINITNRCTLRCHFCPKFNHIWKVRGYKLRLRRQPTVAEILVSLGDASGYKQIVFCGLGEPTLRLKELLTVAKDLHAKGLSVRLNTDGLANLIHGRDIVPDLIGHIDALSISLNGQNEAVYNKHCRPARRGAYKSMLAFAESASKSIPDVTLTAIDGLDGVDIKACQTIASQMGLKFRARRLGVVG